MKTILICIAGGAASGVLLLLALPPANQWWLGGICLVPVLACVSEKGLLPGFFGGLTVPCVTAGLAQTSLIYRLPALNPDPKWILVGCGYFGFLIVAICCVAAETRLKEFRRAALLGALALVLELALFPILPAHLALTQYNSPGMMMIASFGGIWLVSLLLWMTNSAVAEFVRRRSARPAIVFVGTLIAIYLLGLIPPGRPGPSARVAAVQTEETDEPSLRDLNMFAGTEGAQIAVWPEFAGLTMAPGGDSDAIRRLSAEPGQIPFVTSFRDDHEPLPHNAAALFSNGSESAHYFKRKLFGGERNMHAPGDAPVAVAFGDRGVGMNICYDSCYPRMVCETAGLRDVAVIALPTIDPDSTNCFVAATHAAFTTFRAAESGVPIIRADGGAFSMIVDGAGRIVKRLGAGEGVLVADVPIGRRFTLYSVLGDWVLYLSALYLILEAARSIRRAATKRATPEPEIR